VAGIEEAKDEVTEIIEFLKNPKKFQRLGGRIPRGVLLIGEPGCGKTLLAKAVAGEAEVPFFSISGSDFVEMFVGVGASRVRDLFKQAKDNSPLHHLPRRDRRRRSPPRHRLRLRRARRTRADAQRHPRGDGRLRNQRPGHRHRRDQPRRRARPGADPPGRFDRQISRAAARCEGPPGDPQGPRQEGEDGPIVDLEKLARGTPMFSGADLAAIINEAAIIATLANKDFVEMADLEEARDKVKFGRAYKSRRGRRGRTRGTAYHEAGHAVVQLLLPDADPLHKVTIIPRGQAMGATFSLPEKDRYGYGRRSTWWP
jgi:cell division protease FtsH